MSPGQSQKVKKKSMEKTIRLWAKKPLQQRLQQLYLSTNWMDFFK
jgi:hypothetical protein